MNVSGELEKHGESFLQSFEAIRRALQLYPGSHPKVGEQLERFVKTVRGMHADLEQATANVINKEFFINGLPLKKLSIAYAKSLATWESLGLGLVRFSPAFASDAALRFFQVLQKDPDEIAEAGGVRALLAAEGVDGIVVTGIAAELGGELLSVFDASSLAGADASSPLVARSRYEDSKAVFATLVEHAREARTSAASALVTAAWLLEERIEDREPVADLLGRLREHHEPSWRHAVDGALVAVLIGDALGLAPERLQLLAEAAALRDTGKLDVPPAVLDHPAAIDEQRAEQRASAAQAVGTLALSEDQVRREYERHPRTGAKRLLREGKFDPSAAIVALEHHARFDGHGFPALVHLGERGGLHPFSRVVAVAAAYDRLAGARAGEAPLTPGEALARLVAGAGSVYDPAAVRALVSIAGLFPEGTAVRLADGRSGISAGVGSAPGSPHWGRPDVVVLRDAGGKAVEPSIVTTAELPPPADRSPAVVLEQGMREDLQRLRRAAATLR